MAEQAPDADEFPWLARLNEVMLARREFLKLAGASASLAGLSACGAPPPESILPYTTSPELTPGETVFYATALEHDGYALGVLVETHEGRPTKIEGNPLHPASRGATDIFAQAAILELWDPARSQSVLGLGQPASWNHFLAALEQRRQHHRQDRGAGLALLTRTITSPTLAAQMESVLTDFPDARWYAWQPVSRENVLAGAEIAFGEIYEPQWRFENARIIVALDADFLGAPSGGVTHAAAFARHREPHEGRMSRLYAVECMPSLTGANADHCLSLRSSRVETFARALAARLGVIADRVETSAIETAFIDRLVADLHAHGGASLLLAGDRQPPAVHALVHAMNAALGNTGKTLYYIAPPAARPARAADVTELARRMAADEVQTLIVLDGNPVYDAPADLPFRERLARVPFSVHLGLYADETAAACRWHIPLAHPLESWGDTRAHNGTASIRQPLIAPLYHGHTAHDIVATLAGQSADAHEAVKSHWRAQHPRDFDAVWRTALRTGLIDGSAAEPVVPRIVPGLSARISPTPPGRTGIEIGFQPDPTVWDGRHACNAWLQELPKPITKLTWGNAVHLSSATAERLNIVTGDVLRIAHRGRTLEAPAWITPHHADDAITLTLGYGRTHADPVGSGHGYDACRLRFSDALWFDTDARVERTGRRVELANAQPHAGMEGRDLIRHGTLAEYRANPRFAQREETNMPSLFPEYRYDGYAWAMSINLNTCTGCSACVIACQAENNIPAVGMRQVQLGREMHWLRIDRYYEGARTLFQPVTCMHCERAPCEPVCPVAASVHDGEGLNVQVYNRCIGTRFCSQNCPYKVRRFNFLQYAGATPADAARNNPDVTVRMRGVMEKCTYCIQRISRARILAEREGRRIRDGEVVTACQAACPTNAIVFGDLNDPHSRVRALKEDARVYALLGELRTKPRTTYMAKLWNPRERGR